MLLLEQLVTLIDVAYTSGSQLVAMQNYMLQRGHTERGFVLRVERQGNGRESKMTLAVVLKARERDWRRGFSREDRK